MLIHLIYVDMSAVLASPIRSTSRIKDGRRDRDRVDSQRSLGPGRGGTTEVIRNASNLICELPSHRI